MNIHLVDISAHQLTFNWSIVTSNCSAVTYGITSSNCGRCPEYTSHNVASCYRTPIIYYYGQTQCYFSVRTNVCNNIVGDLSETLHVVLKGLFIHPNELKFVCRNVTVIILYHCGLFLWLLQFHPLQLSQSFQFTPTTQKSCYNF